MRTVAQENNVREKTTRVPFSETGFADAHDPPVRSSRRFIVLFIISTARRVGFVIVAYFVRDVSVLTLCDRE